MNILLPIKPKYATRIMDGVKKYEFRTKVPKQIPDYLLVYAAAPIKKVVARVKVLGIMKDTPERLFEQTELYAGIDKKHFLEYFKNRKIAYAYKLGSIEKFNPAKDLKEYGINYIPQNYVYIKK